MTRVDSDAWIPKAKKRKAYRDHVRDKFYKEVGMKKGAVVQEHTGAPQKQRVLATQLLNLTRKGSVPDGAQKEMVTLMAKSLGSTGLGVGGMGSTAQTQDLLDRYSMKNLRENWFWSPAFFD